MNTAGALSIGTTDLVFTQFSAAGQVTAGTGLAKSGTVMSIEALQPTITQWEHFQVFLFQVILKVLKALMFKDTMEQLLD